MIKHKGLLITVISLFIFVFYAISQSYQTQATKEKNVPVIGILQYVSHPALDDIVAGVYEELADAGFIDGENVQIILQNAQADQSKLTTMSQQLIQQKSDLLIGIATPAAQALANATSEIPIVLGGVTDPVGAQLVKDMQRPGGNITGVSDQVPLNKQLALLPELLPQAKKVGILYASAEDNAVTQVKKMQQLAEGAQFQVVTKAIPSTNEVALAAQTLAESVDVIYLPLDNTIANAMDTIVQATEKQHVPLIVSVDTMLAQGGLAMVGVNQKALGRAVGEMSALILQGQATPAEMPIRVVDEGITAINGRVASQYQVKVPESLKGVVQ